MYQIVKNNLKMKDTKGILWILDFDQKSVIRSLTKLMDNRKMFRRNPTDISIRDKNCGNEIRKNNSNL